tara:strand:- start:333 stop:1037 length:705 start_codon:yes stop_codon:yes gene_type:complete
MGRKKSKANYFTQETEDAIVAYNNSPDHVFRDKIFSEKIYLPLYKLAENIIHTFKFYYTDVDDLEDLKLEIVSLLVEEKLHMFDPTRGAKAFSYFGTIVKRHLINYNNKNYKRVKQQTSMDAWEGSYDLNTPETHPNAMKLKEFFDMYTAEMRNKVDYIFTKQSDLQIADAVLTLFEKRNDLDIFKKKALYIYIREMTGTETPYLTKVINVLKVEFYDMYNTYYEKGLIDLKKY